MGRRRWSIFVWIIMVLSMVNVTYLFLAKKDIQVLSVDPIQHVNISRRLTSIVDAGVIKSRSRKYNQLTLYLWNEPPICGSLVGDLRSHSYFPLKPTRTIKIDSLMVSHRQEDNFGQRILGFIKAPKSGIYEFTIDSTGSSELWFGDDEKNANLIANIKPRIENKMRKLWSNWYRSAMDERSNAMSVGFHLIKDRKYYIEVLHVSGAETGGFVKVGWRLAFGKDNPFNVITRHYLYPYQGKVTGTSSISPKLIEDDLRHFKIIKPTYDSRYDFYKYRTLQDSNLNLLPNCTYSPSYLVKNSVGYFASVFHIHEVSVYPNDHTSHYNGQDYIEGNQLLDESKAVLIVEKFMKTLNDKHPGKFSLQNLVSVERNHDNVKGDRYFINLLLKQSDYPHLLRVTTYVYLPEGKTDICSPQGMQWKHNVHVSIVLSVKNQGHWLKYFIESMSTIYTSTLDENFDVIIVDFNSTDVSPVELLKQSRLKHYKVIQTGGQFSRTVGLQMGADAVTDKHSIILLMDLHLHIPNNFIDNVRRRTIEGRMVFVPYFLRLNCNYTPDRPNGYWEDQTYGIVAIYKSDFQRAGGMNTKEYKYKWGGEDWDLLSRILSNGLEVERFRYPQFYHYYHRRRGTFYSGTLHDSSTAMYYLNMIWQKFLFGRYGKTIH